MVFGYMVLHDFSFPRTSAANSSSSGISKKLANNSLLLSNPFGNSELPCILLWSDMEEKLWHDS